MEASAELREALLYLGFSEEEARSGTVNVPEVEDGQ